MPDRCILIVEDEMLLAMMLEDLLVDGGYRVLTAARVRDAEKLIAAERIDAAVLDVNLGKEQVYPVAARLQEQGVPFLFASAYGRSGVSEEYRTLPVLSKPYSANELMTAIAQLTDTAAPAPH